MKTKLIGPIMVLLAITLTGCGAAATTMAPPATSAPAYDYGIYPAPATAAPATAAPIAQAPIEAAGSSQSSADGSAPTAAVYQFGSENDVSDLQTSNRMIIKNAELSLLVKDTDVAIDGVTQIAGDLGGYIVSSRVWYEDVNGKSMKSSTITLGVPVLQFETMMRRLRSLSVKVQDERASGEDVTDQFVDLQSQLQNLEATRDRIRSFLANAKNVDEALKVNQQLTDIEGQIEKIQGQMNYLQNRSAYSTITVTLAPEPPLITPTPTATPTMTPTATPTATPTPWMPGKTFNQAGTTLTCTYRGVANILIWIFVFLIPILLPPALIVWGIVYLSKRKSIKQKLAGTLEK